MPEISTSITTILNGSSTERVTMTSSPVKSQRQGLTRNRERLVCSECHRRKLKCDRQDPCGACARRKDGQNCCYRRFPREPPAEGHGRQIQLESRLSYLEQVVREVAPQYVLPNPAATGSGSVHPGPVPTSQYNPLDSDVIHGATHWSSVWRDIQDLRLAVATDSDLKPATSANPTPSCIEILFGKSEPMDMKQILARYLPSRKELDRHVSAAFKDQVIAATNIHIGQFQRLYRHFWQDPLSASPLWVSILFSLCDIARNAVSGGGPGDDGNVSFPQAAAHCLVLGNYFRPQPWCPEALVLFVQSRCLSSAVLPTDVVSVFSLAVRVTMAMGYHQRPETLDISPFTAEMRRRTWSLLTQLDLLTSFHLGLPRSTPLPMDVVDPPRNINDSDYDEDCSELPAPKPLEEPTNIQFAVAKQQLMDVFDKILRAALVSQQNLVSLDKLQALHDEVESVYHSMPERLKARPMVDSVFDSASLIVTRLCIMFIYTKSLCVLHRPYVLLRRPESIKACYHAATTLTWGICDAYYEFRPGGQANSQPWFIASLTWHDFLLGTVALCLSALVGRSASAGLVDTEATSQLLSQISAVCAEQGDTRGAETKRVRQIAEATMARLRSGEGLGSLMDGIDSVDSGSAEAPRESWINSIPEPMEDALWDEYMGQYLNLDMLLDS